MTPREFFYLTANVRQAQKAYFKSRDQQDLRLCKALEKELDMEIARVKAIEAQQIIDTEASNCLSTHDNGMI